MHGCFLLWVQRISASLCDNELLIRSTGQSVKPLINAQTHTIHPQLYSLASVIIIFIPEGKQDEGYLAAWRSRENGEHLYSCSDEGKTPEG